LHLKQNKNAGLHKGKPFAISKLPKSNLIFWKKFGRRPKMQEQEAGQSRRQEVADSNRSHAAVCGLRYLLEYVAKKPFPKSVRWHFPI
jgi:hypothetical protein